MDNTTSWLIALTVGLVGLVMYVYYQIYIIKEAILILAEGELILSGVVETIAESVDKLVPTPNPASTSAAAFTNTDTIAQSKKLTQKALNKIK